MLRMPILFDLTKATAQIMSNSLPHQMHDFASSSKDRFRPDRKALLFALADELDQYPLLIEKPRPLVSMEAVERSLGTEATFTFYIDTSGRVRMPRLVNTIGDPDPQVLFAAIETLGNWRFKPLTSKRKPVIFKASQKFIISENWNTQQKEYHPHSNVK